MIDLSRVSALIVRHLIPTFRDPIRISDMLYWPFVDIILIGFIGVWAQESMTQTQNFTLALLASVAIWYVMQRSALEISRNFLVEIWDNNISNIIASPLTIWDMFASFMVVGIIQALVTFVYTLIIIWVLFSQNLFLWLPYLIPLIPLVILSGWSIGLLTASLIFYFGRTADALAWTLPFAFAMISGVYYPLRLFPSWMQTISALFPASYVFDAVKDIILLNQIPYLKLTIGLALALLYLLLTLKLMHISFKKAKERGLNTLF